MQTPTFFSRHRKLIWGGVLLALGGLLFTGWRSGSALQPVSIPPAALADSTPVTDSAVAVLAGGCFWGVEAVFEHTRGVQRVESGYSGGTAQSAHYNVVSGGRTDHAESVRIVYDPSQLSYAQILQIFFSVVHDPTQLNRQGPDRGRQYRSAIFYATPEQERIASAYIKQLTAAKVFSDPIVTQVVPLSAFYPAESYHQDFAELNPTHPYIVAHDLPKVARLKQTFSALYRTTTTRTPRSAR